MPIPIHTHPQDSQNVVGFGEPTFDINCSQLESV
ncbi:unnamed protein product, partial [Rotaria magnacalcarata]